MEHDNTIPALVARYRVAALGTGTLDPKKNNKNVDMLHSCYKHLRATEEGRAGIILLVSDDNPHVRVWAAAHSLEWDPAIARPALEALRDSNGPASFAAKWTLKEYDEGNLSFDY